MDKIVPVRALTMTSGSDLIVLRRYPHQIHAELAKSALDASGLTTFLYPGGYGQAHETPEIELLVGVDDAERALEILGPPESFSY